MSEDDEHQLHQEHDDQPGEDRLDWGELGRVAPRVQSGRLRPCRDLGPGGSLAQDARRARRLRQPERWCGAPVVRTLLGAGGVVAAVALVALMAGVTTWLAVSLFVLSLPPLVAGAHRAYRRPASEARLLARARTERCIAVELDGLAVSGWVLLHDRVLPGGEHRVAHIAVGPPGVFIVAPIPDTGPLRIVGAVEDEIDNRELYAGPLHLGVWLNTRRWELEQLEPAIAAGMEDVVWTGPTAGVAVLVPAPQWWRFSGASTDVPEIPYEWNGVEFRPLGVLLDTLTELPSTLDRPAVAALAAVVEGLCPPAGRVDEPQDSPTSNSVG
ncbi:MAG: hypothetical protein ACRDRU_21275 [Pseudonocardiaceae bacterium]